MARTFTPYELIDGITVGQWNAMSKADQDAFDLALVNLWVARAAWADALYLSEDRAPSPLNLRHGHKGIFNRHCDQCIENGS